MQISRKDFFVDNVRDGSYCGTVVDIEDPLKIGRVRIEVFGFFDGLEPNLIPLKLSSPMIPPHKVLSKSKTIHIRFNPRTAL